MKTLMIKIYRALLQLIFPLRCPVCDDIVTPYGEKICPDCRKKLKYVTSPWCMKCGKKLGKDEEICTDCRKIRHKFTRGRALYEYNSAAAMIYRFKYAGRREYADFFGLEIAKYLGDFIKDVKPDALIPVPIHKKRLKKRGFNQAALLARAVGRYTGIPVDEKLVVRIKNTVPLKLLNPNERQNNLKKAFNIVKNDVKLNTILIIDDIYTSGSTVDEMSSVLHKAGVENVYFITLSCGA